MNLNVVCNINQLSYGVVSFYILKYLYIAGVNVSLFPMANCDIGAYVDQDCTFIHKMIENSKFFDSKAPTLRIFHQFAMAESVGSGKRIGWAFFELDNLKKNEVHHINSLDCFIVSSKWAKEVCINSGVKTKVEVVTPSCERKCEKKIKEVDCVDFLCIGKFEVRKCHDLIISAFGEAFSLFDNVRLNLMTFNPFNSGKENEQWENLIKSSKNANKIRQISPIERHSDVLNSYQCYDCLIGLSRAEGFNLPLFEAMSHGLLCIANDNTAMEYVNEKNCVYIEKNGETEARDNKWFFGDGKWADFKQKDIVDGLRRAYSIIKEQRQREITDVAKRDLVDMTWQNSAEKIKNIIFA